MVAETSKVYCTAMGKPNAGYCHETGIDVAVDKSNSSVALAGVFIVKVAGVLNTGFALLSSLHATKSAAQESNQKTDLIYRFIVLRFLMIVFASD